MGLALRKHSTLWGNRRAERPRKFHDLLKASNLALKRLGKKELDLFVLTTRPKLNPQRCFSWKRRQSGERRPNERKANKQTKPTTIENRVQWVELIQAANVQTVTVHFSTELICRAVRGPGASLALL